MPPKYIAAGLFAMLVLGYSIGRYTTPPQIITKTEVQEKEVIKDNVVTVTKTITLPNGTTETDTTVNDQTVKSVEVKESTIAIIPVEKQWHASLGAEHNFSDGINIYDVTVERRILLNTYLGVRVNTNKEVGLTIGLDF